MTSLVPVSLFSWVPISIAWFMVLKPQRAVLLTVIGGWLLLPMAVYNIPGIPAYTKNTAIALGLVLGGRISGKRSAVNFRWRIYDLPMLVYCLCPIATSLANGLGLYDGLSVSFQQIIIWGIPYLAGRVYFGTIDDLRDLCLGIVVGGLVYVPLCWYEIRMSPQLSNIFYGFFPHSFAQHLRYGGFRPIVFMQHGLMVALWMAVCSVVAYWLWRSGREKAVANISIKIAFFLLALTTVLCKSVNGWFALLAGILCYRLYRNSQSNRLLKLLVVLIPAYLAMRLFGIISANTIEDWAGHFVNADRVESLGWRLLQEDLFSERALMRPVFGWGGYMRGWPIDPETGERVKIMIDSTWLIALSMFGFVGLVSFVMAILNGPWQILRNIKGGMASPDDSTAYPIVLAVIVVLFAIDSLFNGMVNPIYILASGGLVAYIVNQKAAANSLISTRWHG